MDGCDEGGMGMSGAATKLWSWNVNLTCLLMTRGSGTYVADVQGSRHGGSSMTVEGRGVFNSGLTLSPKSVSL